MPTQKHHLKNIITSVIVFTLVIINITNSIKVEADTKQGYHIEYHTTDWTEWGDLDKLENCSSFDTEKQDCQHYRRFNIVTLFKGEHTDQEFEFTDGTKGYIWGDTYYYKASETVTVSCRKDIRYYTWCSSIDNCTKNSKVGKVETSYYYRWLVNGQELQWSNEKDAKDNVISISKVNMQGGTESENTTSRTLRKNSNGDYSYGFIYGSGLNSTETNLALYNQTGPGLDWWLQPSEEGLFFYDKDESHTMYRHKCNGHETPNTYTVQFDGNGSTQGKMSNQDFVYDSEQNLNKNTYTKTGYTFGGWSDDAGNTYIDEQSVKNLTVVDKDTVVLKAIWNPITYEIVYNGNGNTNSQQSYSQTVTFDRLPIKLDSNKFIKDGYEFIGWSNINGGKTVDYSNEQELKSNLTSVQGAKIELYAVWRKELSLIFNLNGGKYKGIEQEIKSSAYIYNDETSYNFGLYNNKKVGQQTSLDIYGTIIDNGLNNSYTKQSYRFLGWSLDKDSTKPDIQFDVYSTNRIIEYTINKNTRLYAVWEPILQVGISLKRTLGDIQFEYNNGEVLTNTLSNLTAANKNNIVSTIIKPGEQGFYSITLNENVTEEQKQDRYIAIKFDTKITGDSNTVGIYSDPTSVYYDNLNPINDTENLEPNQTCGLNRLIKSYSNNFIERKFFVPIYLGTDKSPYPDCNKYEVAFIISQPSYYYKNYVENKESETIEITGFIYITKGPTDSTNNVENTLSELKTKLKIRVK